MLVRVMVPLSGYRFEGSLTLALLGLALLIAIFIVIAYMTKTALPNHRSAARGECFRGKQRRAEEKMGVKLSERAAIELKKIMASGGFGPETFLRLILNASGACAQTYKLELDSSKKETDAAFESHGLVVAVKKEDLRSLAGTVIDWREEGLISGFVINNPAAKSTCSCSKTHEQKCSD